MNRDRGHYPGPERDQGDQPAAHAASTAGSTMDQKTEPPLRLLLAGKEFLEVRAPVRLPAVYVFEPVFVRQAPRALHGSRLCRDLRVGGQGRDRAPDVEGRFRGGKMRVLLDALLPVRLADAERSSTASERRKPGVRASAVTPWGRNSSAMLWARRMTDTLARS